jgi:preflagellin peptidase FlaK
MGTAGAILTSLTYALGFYRESWLISLISIGATSALAFALFYIGLYGGADAKALIALSLTLPTPPTSLQPLIWAVIPIFPISALLNGVLFSVLTVPYMAVKNIRWKVENRRKLFEGLEHEPTLKKAATLLSSAKYTTSELRKRKFYDIVENLEQTPTGISRHLKLMARVEDVEEPIDLDKLDSLLTKSGGSRELWVTPQLPMLVFILIGFASALMLGDLITGLLTTLISR